MSLGLGLTIYAALIAFVSAIMIYYYKVMYRIEEAKLREKSNDSKKHP